MKVSDGAFLVEEKFFVVEFKGICGAWDMPCFGGELEDDLVLFVGKELMEFEVLDMVHVCCFLNDFYSPLLRVAALHKLVVLSVVADELLGECASDVDLDPIVTVLCPLDAFSEVYFLFSLLDGFEDPPLVHSIVDIPEYDLVFFFS